LLRSAADVIIQTGLPMLLAWGPDLHMYFNTAFARILGPGARKTLGMRMRDAWAAAWPEFHEVLERALLGETVFVEDWAVHTQRSDFKEIGYFTVTYSPLLEGGQVAGLVCVCFETTEKVGREKQLRRMQSEMIHVARTTAMQAMASTLAHELNQPLAAIGAYLAGAERLFASRDPPDLKLLREAIHEARESSERAADIVRRTRELLRTGLPKTERVDVAALVRTAFELACDKQTRSKIKLGTAIDDGASIECDEVQLQQVLINLIRNAVEAMEHSRSRQLLISAHARDNETVFVIEDSGQGVPESVRSTLFEAFQSGKTGGMGVGLSISRTIIEAHGGRLWLERSSEAGTRFCFTIPARPGAASS
jgi:two-component system, LuxR family, sensor kinase FixL